MQTTLIQIEESQLKSLLEKAAEIGAMKATELVRTLKKEDWISEKQAMELLNCKRSFLFGLRDQKKIECSRIASRICLYSRKSIIRLIESRTK